MKESSYSLADILSRVILVFLIAIMLTSTGLFLGKKILLDRMRLDWPILHVIYAESLFGSKPKPQAINWEKKYPFANQAVAKENFFARLYNHAVTRKLAQKEDNLRKYIPFYYSLVETNKRYDMLLSWNISSPQDYNAIITRKDGTLTGLTARASAKEIKTNVNGIIRLREVCSKVNIPLLYVQQLGKNSAIFDDGIDGVLDYSNENADRFLAELRAENIPFLDLRELAPAKNQEEYHALFFKTDHHWKPQTGFWAAAQLTHYLNENYGLGMDEGMLTSDKFYAVHYENYFLGSQGKKATLAKTTPDDFDLLYTKVPVHLRFEAPAEGVATEGGLEACYNMDMVKSVDYYLANPYAAYTYGDQPLSFLRNETAAPVHILYIKDSFSNPETVALALVCGQLDMIDVRNFTGSIEAYINETRPDLVIVAYNPGMVGNHDAGGNIRRSHMFDFK